MAKPAFHICQRHRPYDSVGLCELGVWVVCVWGGRFPHNFVSRSIYFLLNSEPKPWKQKWKPGEEQTFSPPLWVKCHVKGSLPLIPWVIKIRRQRHKWWVFESTRDCVIFLKFLDARFGGHQDMSAEFCHYCRECTSVCGQFHREVASAGI